MAALLGIVSGALLGLRWSRPGRPHVQNVGRVVVLSALGSAVAVSLQSVWPAGLQLLGVLLLAFTAAAMSVIAYRTENLTSETDTPL